MLTLWTLCLLALAFIVKGPAMWRTWAALLAASIAGKAFPDPVAWAFIDLIAAITVIFPPRKGFQKAIAALFAAMLFLELGWLLSERMNVDYVISAGSLLGWLQLAALLTWGLDERYGTRRFLDWVLGTGLARPGVAQE
jgi:hypothetical protein